MNDQKTDDAPDKKTETARKTDKNTFGATFLRELKGGSATLTLLSIVLALAIGAVLIAASDDDVTAAAKYFFARPGDTFAAIGDSVGGAYAALFQGSVINFSDYTVLRALEPLADTLTYATPLIAAGLGVALAFQAGLFNIGAQGQIILGAVFAAYIGGNLHMPPVVQVGVAVIAGLVGGALWAGIAGYLKAKTGAHEVIVTIMLNNVALFLVAYLLTTSVFRRPGRTDPIGRIIEPNALLYRFFGQSSPHLTNFGIVLALVAAAIVWWLLNKSTVGFTYRAVGFNPAAARTAGMSVERSYISVMMIAGALAGLAGATEVLGTQQTLTTGISGSIGFDAITVALLGRSKPVGTVLAGLLFGALKAGGVVMQAQTGTDIDIVQVVQALVVLFIAAPPLVRTIFHLKASKEARA
ncbi:ABC transporter permease [Spelaeicoccus albus]|uniref:Simple sugar transport system permease protein n=1 Tax=Spelaeicoccus albus TaxID=1280376 RepID=A0A7Z0IJ85_9MICO|nr:ABC transporter permease [Spelaeicoccus albus]NYI69274.1 simple sugar transport system permease protein [Spelaeicoccus albus]